MTAPEQYIEITTTLPGEMPEDYCGGCELALIGHPDGRPCDGFGTLVVDGGAGMTATVLREELAAATDGRPGWSRQTASSYSTRRLFILRTVGGEWSGDVIGNPDGWWWSVWHHGNPVRSIDDDAAPSAAAAVEAVESFIARRGDPQQCGECKASVDTRHLEGCGGQFHEEFVTDYRGGAA